MLRSKTICQLFLERRRCLLFYKNLKLPKQSSNLTCRRLVTELLFWTLLQGQETHHNTFFMNSSDMQSISGDFYFIFFNVCIISHVVMLLFGMWFAIYCFTLNDGFFFFQLLILFSTSCEAHFHRQLGDITNNEYRIGYLHNITHLFKRPLVPSWISAVFGQTRHASFKI